MTERCGDRIEGYVCSLPKGHNGEHQGERTPPPHVDGRWCKDRACMKCYSAPAAPGVDAEHTAWLEDELMEVMRIVAHGMTPETQADEIVYAMMVTAIRRLMEADEARYEAVLESYQKRHPAPAAKEPT